LTSEEHQLNRRRWVHFFANACVALFQFQH
jgi:hypothetical protein